MHTLLSLFQSSLQVPTLTNLPVNSTISFWAPFIPTNSSISAMTLFPDYKSFNGAPLSLSWNSNHKQSRKKSRALYSNFLCVTMLSGSVPWHTPHSPIIGCPPSTSPSSQLLHNLSYSGPCHLFWEAFFDIPLTCLYLSSQYTLVTLVYLHVCSLYCIPPCVYFSA